MGVNCKSSRSLYIEGVILALYDVELTTAYLYGTEGHHE